MPTPPMYQTEVRHQGLHKYRLIEGTSGFVVERMAADQVRIWEEMWAKKQATESAMQELKERAARWGQERKKELAAARTEAAQAALERVENTLTYALNLNDRIEWDSLLDHSSFPQAKTLAPQYHPLPREPKQSDAQFAPERYWYHALLRNLRGKALHIVANRFRVAHEQWRKEMTETEHKNKALETKYTEAVSKWEEERQVFLRDQKKRNDRVLEEKEAYFNKDPQAIVEYCELVLSRSVYPESFPQEFNLDYQSETRILVIDYFLPSPEDIPTLKEVKYVASRDAVTEVTIQESAFNKMYDDLLYKITLRTLHEIYKADQIDSIAAVVFNGWVRSFDKGTGKPITVCILSVQAGRDEFLTIDLRKVDPKICFKTLRGVGSSKLHGLSPIAPILQLTKEDKRFVSSYSVVGDVDQSTNLAAMDWEDFEHLIRELFEKEFSQYGGEVKITQASRDRGVDAVAFDPDPIRGGKIVIQAKRYTNVVGVSAVRDLYGTVVNEGATKGILVTTADYGPDAYAFAKGKPLTLLNGSNLLHLLEKHGCRATIDLKAARQILADEKKAEEKRPEI